MTIRYTTGNLLEAESEALVNTVNEVGVMGKGIALMFRDAFPENTRQYTLAAQAKEIRVGKMFVTENYGLNGPRWIINFPTKKHWRHPSKLEWIREGLSDLARIIRGKGIRSIAIPPLGSGAGGLNWTDVRSEIDKAFADVEGVDVVVFEPTRAYQTAPKQHGVEELTTARALIAELVRRYEVLGLECTILEVQKLAFFLKRALEAHRLPDVLRLKFKANKFGPYDDKLRHLLNALDGSFLHADKRLADAGPFDLIRFDYARQEAVIAYLHSESARAYLPAVEYLSQVIDGFESPLGMELLATVEWLLVNEGVTPTVTAIRGALQRWPGGAAARRRKTTLLDDRLVSLALERLNNPPVVVSDAGLFRNGPVG